MSHQTQPPSGADAAAQALAEAQLRRSVQIGTLLALLLPPLVGGTLMGVVGFYPLPELYLVFLSYSGFYVLAVLVAGFFWARHIGNYLVALGRDDPQAAEARARRLFQRLPWRVLGVITLYTVVGALSADFSLQRLGYLNFDRHDQLYRLFGLLPVVLVTVFPIYFYFTDLVGRYLAPRGISAIVIPLGVKLSMLGIVSPLLVDSLLISYFVNQTGHFSTKTLILWGGLMVLAAGGTWLAWRSVRQGVMPMQSFLAGQSGALVEADVARLVPLSLDEFGVLTSRFALLLKQQQKLTDELRSARTLSHAVIESAGVLVVVLDREGRMVRFNQACERLSGYRSEEMLGRFPWDTVLPPEEAELIRQQAFEAPARNPQALAGQYTNPWVSRDGQRFLIEWINTLLFDASGAMEFMVSVGVDVTQRQRKDAALRESERKYRRLHESMSDAFAQVDMAGHLVEWNHAYQAMLGYSPEELRRLTYQELTPQKWHAPEAQIIEQQVLARGYSDVYEKEYVRKDGTVLPVELRTFVLRDDAGAATGMWAIVRDIGARKAAEARISSLAYFDPLTGLPNRVLFTDRLQLALAHARRDNGRVGVLFVDLDKFKPVNDSYGHAMGDQLLQVAAQRMRECVRESDTVGRLGGDEFVVLLPEINSSEDALAVAKMIHAALRQPVVVSEFQLEVSSCIGVAIFPEHGHDEAQLMKHADAAMYRAKESGRDQVALVS